VKTFSGRVFSGRVIKHSLSYLTVHKRLVGCVPFYLKFLAKLTHPFKNTDFQHSAVTLAKEFNH